MFLEKLILLKCFIPFSFYFFVFLFSFFFLLLHFKICAHFTNLGLFLFFSRKEREGIPPELLQQLDVCVEIPQQGIIRSLNVHVSGALLIWEYARQHMDMNQT